MIVCRPAVHRTCSSPATHCISSRELVTVSDRKPVRVSTLTAAARRSLQWNGTGLAADAEAGCAGAVFMAPIFPRTPRPINVQNRSTRT